MAPPGGLIRHIGVHVIAEETTQIIPNFHFRYSSHRTRFNGPERNALRGMPSKSNFDPSTHTLLGLKSMVMK